MTSTELRRRKPDHRSTSHHFHLIWAAGAILLFAAFGAGCDTTAKISFPSRSFDDIHSTGMIGPANACGSLGQKGGSTTKLRFAMIADDGTAIRPPRKGGSPLDSGEVTLDKDKMSYSKAGAVFEHPDLRCGGGGGQKNNGDFAKAIQPLPDGCGSQFSCQVGVSDGQSYMKRCQIQSGYTVQGVKHVANVDNHQLFGVLVENAGSLEGFPPGESGGWYYDANGDGTAEKEIETQYPDLRATDYRGNRITALKDMVPNWKKVQKAAFAEDRRTFFGLWTYSGAKNPKSMVNEATEDETIWTENAEVVDRATTEGGPNSDGVFPSRTDAGSRGNVLEATQSVINKHYGGDEFSDTEKTLVVFTDGPPEVHPDRHGVMVDKVIETAKSANVRIFMVHLDEKVGSGKTEDVLDDLQYYQDQEEQCSSDGDCRPHETCRKVRGYSTQLNGDVTADVNGRYHNQGMDATYCMPQRRQDGRTGPLSIYSKLACATEGGYQYIKTNRDISWAMSWLPYTLDGLWEADVNVQEISRGNYTSNAPIRLQARFNVRVGGSDVLLDLSQTGGEVDENIPESGDARSVVVTGQ